jgi:hypothetical protein
MIFSQKKCIDEDIALNTWRELPISIGGTLQRAGSRLRMQFAYNTLDIASAETPLRRAL